MKLRHKIILLYLACLALALVMKGCEAEEVNIEAIIKIESGGDQYAHNKISDAIGLMQITPIVLKEWNIEKNSFENSCASNPPCELCKAPKINLYCPEDNRRVGSWYLKKQLTKYLNYYKIPLTTENYLIAWHDGIGNLVKYKQGKRKLGKEMKGYLKKYEELNKI